MLTSGTRLGPYEILSPLGAGGMGEVYKARDSKLNREIAVKVLPESLSGDPDSLARFEREAHAVAALNHPNILSIHDFGNENGVAYAVTELLEGETLRARLEGSALPQRRAIEIAIQISRGLAAAHEKGIVHRDLKPENVFLTSDGRVKILDFGLAKKIGLEAAETNAPTTAGTEPGTVMGTVGYMSPEQVRGRNVDHRTDIFSFGAILYEMLSGMRAFRRESGVETMNAILKEEPPELLESGRKIAPALDRIVRHCLEKSPESRFHSAGDVAFNLETMTADSSPSGPAPKMAVAHSSRGRRLIAVTFLLIAAAAFLAGRRTRREAGQTRLPDSFIQVTDIPGVESAPTLSPDGKNVVYVSDVSGRLGLFLLHIGGRTPVALTADSSANDSQPAFSPDGEQIAFRSERDGGGIFVMGSTGESVKRLTDFGYNPSWSPDGREIVVATSFFLFPTDMSALSSDLVAVDVATGRKREVLTNGHAFQPGWSPHGTRIAYWGVRGASGQRDLWTVAADGSEKKSAGADVTNDPALDWSPAWSPDGKSLFFSSNRGGTMNLWRIPIDERSGRVGGAPEPVTTPSTWSGEVSFSRDGKRFAYASLDWHSTLLKIGFDPRSETTVSSPIPILKSTRPIRDHQMSPDGGWAAFSQTGGQEDLIVARADGGEYRRLTDDTHRNRAPVWSPDGKSLVFYSDRSGTYQLWMIRPDGSGLEQLTQGSASFDFAFWSPDGAQLASSIIPSGAYLIDMRSNASPRPKRKIPPLDEKSGFWPLGWSPDGTRLAGILVKRDGKVRDLATYTLSTGKYDLLEFGRDAFFEFPTWLADSRRLLVRTQHGLTLVDSATKKTKPILSVGGYWIGMSAGITRDDRWITYTETGTEGDIWLAEMK